MQNQHIIILSSSSSSLSHPLRLSRRSSTTPTATRSSYPRRSMFPPLVGPDSGGGARPLLHFSGALPWRLPKLPMAGSAPALRLGRRSSPALGRIEHEDGESTESSSKLGFFFKQFTESSFFFFTESVEVSRSFDNGFSLTSSFLSCCSPRALPSAQIGGGGRGEAAHDGRGAGHTTRRTTGDGR